MTRRITTLLAATLLAIGMIAGPAMAKPDKDAGAKGNSFRAQSTPAEVTVTESGDWYRIQHDLGVIAEDTVWNEPVKFGGENTQASSGDAPADTPFDVLWLPVDGHKGPVTVYYDTGDGWEHVTAQFNGKGELVHVNGERL